MTLADFLNYLPQTYSGIAAGRGSAPNELNPEFGQRTENSFPSFNFVLGASDAPPGQTGVSGVSLRGLGSGSTLVLIDGRRAAKSGSGNRSTSSQQGFVDLNTIPLGMIDHIEVITDGASAIYGADAVAGVINVVLKRNWQGNELSSSYRASAHGGGRERQVTLTTGFAAGKLSGSVAVDYYDRGELKASDRSFSKNQDHRGVIATYDANGKSGLWPRPAAPLGLPGSRAGAHRHPEWHHRSRGQPDPLRRDQSRRDRHAHAVLVHRRLSRPDQRRLLHPARQHRAVPRPDPQIRTLRRDREFHLQDQRSGRGLRYLQLQRHPRPLQHAARRDLGLHVQRFWQFRLDRARRLQSLRPGHRGGPGRLRVRLRMAEDPHQGA